MITVQVRRWVMVMALLLAATLSSDAQTGKQPAPGQLRDSGSKPWVVVKGSLNDFTGKSDAIVADFGSEKDARDQAQRLNESLKGDGAYKWLFTHRKRKQDDPQPPTDPPTAQGKKIEFQKPKFIDVGPLKKGEKGSVLAGKKGQGKIGDFNVTIEFGNDGQFIISGDIQGKGKWSETEAGGVYMETERSTFRGNIKGDVVSGLWFTKDNSRPLTEWSIELGTTDDPDGKKKDEAKARGDKFTLYDPLNDKYPVFETFEAAKEAAKKTAAAYDAKYPGVNGITVWVKTPDRDLEVYHVRSTKGKFMENEYPLLLKKGQEYLKSRDKK